VIDDVADREHPAAERLSAYLANELSPEESDAIQEHVASCRLCAERLLDLQGFLGFKPQETSQGVTDLETAREWRRLWERIGGIEKQGSLDSSLERGRLLRSLRTFQVLAAVLGALSIGLTVYAVRLQGWPREIYPIPEKTVVFARMRSAGTLEEIDIKPPVALKFFVDADYPRYAVEIRARGGRLLYSYDRYRKADLDRSTLPLEAGDLAPGTYSLRLLGVRNGRPEPIGSPVKLIVHP